MSQFADIEKFITNHRADFEEDLIALLRIPSISSDSQYRDSVRRAGEWVHDHLQALGLKAELIETCGHPLVLASSDPVPGKPTVLVYGHYDVQPPDPLNEWVTPPFEPTRRDGNLFARGATDDKGQMLTHVKSAEAWIKGAGRLPVQLKFLIEGEEESGSAGLYEFLEQQADRLAADIVVISDTSQFGPGQPAITYGLKGLTYYELHLQGPAQDLHSGSFGGAVTNPANALTQMLAALRDDQGRVTLPGFYDRVIPLTQQERNQFAALPFSEQQFMSQVGVQGVTGEQGYTTLERRWARPTFDINGLTSGYQGEGAKTVLPAKASAKFSFRLVPDQNPAEVTQSLQAKLESLCPPGIQMRLVDMHGAPGFVLPLESEYMGAAARAIEKGFGKSPVFIREGGSIPIVTAFKKRLGIDTLLLGWGQDDDNMHSPNEKFSLNDYFRGILASAHLWQEIAAFTK